MSTQDTKRWLAHIMQKRNCSRAEAKKELATTVQILQTLGKLSPRDQDYFVWIMEKMAHNTDPLSTPVLRLINLCNAARSKAARARAFTTLWSLYWQEAEL